MSELTEHDIPARANMVIWGYFLAFGVLLYLILAGLNIYFRMEVENEYDVKVGSVKSKELMELRQQEAKELVGIDEAMDKVVREAN